MTGAEFHAELVRLAIEAHDRVYARAREDREFAVCATPETRAAFAFAARERLAQIAQVYAIDVALARERRDVFRHDSTPPEDGS